MPIHSTARTFERSPLVILAIVALASHASLRARPSSIAVPAARTSTSSLATATPKSRSSPLQTGPIINLPSSAFTDTFTFVPDAGQSTVMTIDLALAASGLDGQGQPITWQTPSPVPGQGIYDPEAWAVVFKYSSLIIPSGVSIRFRNHPSTAPVVWLVDADCTLEPNSWLQLDASSGAPELYHVPGPGGFRGGALLTMTTDSAGFGPGGSPYNINTNGRAGTYSTPSGGTVTGTPYGSPSLFPLIGGSGGTRYSNVTGGGAGGGAILVACNGTLTMQSGSRITADSPALSTYAHGSGGGLRLVAATVQMQGTALLRALGPSNGGHGRIRIEGFSTPAAVNAQPQASVGTPGQLFPDSASTPSVRVVSVTLGTETATIPTDPSANLSAPQADVHLDGAGAAVVHVEGRFIAPGRPVYVRVTSVYDRAWVYTGTLSGTLFSTTAAVNVTIPAGVCAVQARAEL
jgi:hypothetical protein